METEALPEAAVDILRECGGLPLALSTVGAMLRGTAPVEWVDTASLLRKADLSAIEEQLPPGQQSFFRTIEVSAKALPQDMQRRYGKPAVLLDDVPAPVPVLQTLWGVDKGEARRIARRLADRSLVQRDAESGVRLHDLQLDYIRANAPDRKALGWVHAAARQSTHVIERDPCQFAGHLTARLLQYRDNPWIHQLIDEIAAGAPRPWLRPLTASLATERSIRWMRPGPAEGLDSVAFSSSGRWGCHVSGSSGAASGEVVLWDLKEWRSCGKRFRPLPRLNPFALALSGDSHWCLYADIIGGVHRLGEAGETWEGRAHRDVTIATLLAISADGRRALSACQHGRLVAWDIDAGRHEIIWDESGNHPQALALDTTGTKAVVAREDGSVYLLNLWPTRDEILCKLPSAPTALARSADKDVVVVATADGRIEVRSLASPRRAISVLSADERPVSVAVSTAARYVAAGTDKGTVEVWSLPGGHRTARYSRAHAYEVKCIAFSDDGARVISADILQIKEWAVKAAGPPESPVMNVFAAGEVKVTANWQHAVAVLEDGRLGVWNLRTGALDSALPPVSGPAFGTADAGPAKALALTGNAPRVLAWNDKLLGVWDLAAGAGMGGLRAKAVRHAAITPDGTGIVYATYTSIVLWKPDSGSSEILGTYEDHPPGHVAVSPDSKYALSLGGDRQVHLWRLDGPSRRRELEEQLRQLKRTSQIDPEIIDARFQTRFAPDASYQPNGREKPSTGVFAGPEEAIVTTGGGEMFVLDLDNKQCRRMQDRHTAGVTRVLVRGDGRSFVTSSWDGTLRLWDLSKRDSIAVLDGHSGIAGRVSASGERILLRSWDGILKLVSLRDGASIAAFQADKQIISCDADEELRWVVALDQGGQVHFLCLEE